MIRTIARGVIGSAALAGALTFGAAGMASAASTGTGTGNSPSAGPSVATHAAKCAKAEALATRIQAREAKAPTWLAAAQAREAKATSAGHPKVAKFIEHRIARVEKLIPKGEKVLAKIAAKCGSATSTS